MSLRRRLLAEGLGSLVLAATVIGSGIMAERLAAGNTAVALLANTGATVAALAVLIAMLGPVSGAHFNPAVSLVEAVRGRLAPLETAAYVGMQIFGCCAGALLAHAMFSLPLVQIGTHVRAGPAQWLSEIVATAGLLLVVRSSPGPEVASWRVAAWIGAAYWFTASTSFANPAITIARALSDTFAGIRPGDVAGFIGAQLVGASLGGYLGRVLYDPPHPRTPDPHRVAADLSPEAAVAASNPLPWRPPARRASRESAPGLRCGGFIDHDARDQGAVLLARADAGKRRTAGRRSRSSSPHRRTTAPQATFLASAVLRMMARLPSRRV